jgi:hypothetical protein
MVTSLPFPSLDSRALCVAIGAPMESHMKYPVDPAQRIARAADIRHARRLESIARAYPSASLSVSVAVAFDRAEGHPGMTRANDLLRARFAYWADKVQ